MVTYNLKRFTMDARDDADRKNDPKPDAECKALAGIIASANPDFPVRQIIGGERPCIHLAPG